MPGRRCCYPAKHWPLHASALGLAAGLRSTGVFPLAFVAFDRSTTGRATLLASGCSAGGGSSYCCVEGMSSHCRPCHAGGCPCHAGGCCGHAGGCSCHAGRSSCHAGRCSCHAGRCSCHAGWGCFCSAGGSSSWQGRRWPIGQGRGGCAVGCSSWHVGPGRQGSRRHCWRGRCTAAPAATAGCCSCCPCCHCWLLLLLLLWRALAGFFLGRLGIIALCLCGLRLAACSAAFAGRHAAATVPVLGLLLRSLRHGPVVGEGAGAAGRCQVLLAAQRGAAHGFAGCKTLMNL